MSEKIQNQIFSNEVRKPAPDVTHNSPKISSPPPPPNADVPDRVAVCVISTNDSYIYKAIITLLSVREKNKENKSLEYFVCGNISEKYKKVSGRYGLNILKMDLKNIFRYTNKYSLPNECFWLCAIPEALYREGFEYTLILDGDIFCIGKIPMNVIKEVQELAFVEKKQELKYLLDRNKKDYRQLFRKHEVIKKLDLNENNLKTFWINSGVGIFNNRNLTKKRFKEKFIKIYEDLPEVAYCRVDEVIFFLLKAKGLFNFYPLEGKWNSFFKFKNDSDEDKIIFLHLHYKPWRYMFLWQKLDFLNDLSGITIEKYQERRKKYKKFYINFCKKIYKNKFYWYYIRDLIPINYYLFKKMIEDSKNDQMK